MNIGGRPMGGGGGGGGGHIMIVTKDMEISPLAKLVKYVDPYTLVLAKRHGIGIPRVMLVANEMALAGYNVNEEIRDLIEKHPDRFEQGFPEPPESFERMLFEALAETDCGWAKIGLGKATIVNEDGLAALEELSLQGIQDLSGETMSHLSRFGWDWVNTGNRMIFRNGPVALKVALDVNGIRQNFKESEYLYRLAGNIGGMYDVEVHVPKLFAWHRSYAWITRQWIPPGDVMPDHVFRLCQKILEQSRYFTKVGDICPANLVWHSGDRKVWLIDAGTTYPSY